MSCSISDSIFHIVVSYFVSNCTLFISQIVQTVVAASKQSSQSGIGGRGRLLQPNTILTQRRICAHLHVATPTMANTLHLSLLPYFYISSSTCTSLLYPFTYTINQLLDQNSHMQHEASEARPCLVLRA